MQYKQLLSSLSSTSHVSKLRKSALLQISIIFVFKGHVLINFETDKM